MTILVQDGFTVSSTTDLTAHTPDTTGTGYTEEENTSATEIARIIGANDDVRMTGDEEDVRALYSAQPNPTEVDVDISYGIGSSNDAEAPMFVFGRFADTDNYYSAGTYRFSANPDIKLVKKTTAGGVVELATANVGPGGTAKLEIRDDAKKLFIAGTEELSSADNDITAAGKSGLGFGNAWVSTDNIENNNQLDDFLSEEFASSLDLPSFVGPDHVVGERKVIGY